MLQTGRKRAPPGRQGAYRNTFRIALYFKAADSLLELLGALALLIVPQNAILNAVRAITRPELTEDAHDVIANLLLRSTEALAFNRKSAAVVFLASHGAIKLFLVTMVLMDKHWAYPVFMIALIMLIAYQCYQLSLGFSPWLAGLTVLDVIVLILTWHEYRAREPRVDVAPSRG